MYGFSSFTQNFLADFAEICNIAYILNKQISYFYPGKVHGFRGISEKPRAEPRAFASSCYNGIHTHIPSILFNVSLLVCFLSIVPQQSNDQYDFCIDIVDNMETDIGYFLWGKSHGICKKQKYTRAKPRIITSIIL